MTFDLDEASRSFAQTVQDLLDKTLPSPREDDPEERRLVVLRQGRWNVLRPGTEEKAKPIKLLSQEKYVANLEFFFRCTPDQSNTFLAIRKSSFQLTSLQEGPPLLRLDFDHGAYKVPSAHWNVHAERGATSVLLARCNHKLEGLLSQVHLPVGGMRNRPCLEDFLDMLFVEFNVDRLAGWNDAICEGREKWRTYQARSIVRDAPEEAAAVLRKLGYKVDAPVDGPPEPNTAMFQGR